MGLDEDFKIAMLGDMNGLMLLPPHCGHLQLTQQLSV
jgi:hypothetical protein